MTADLHVTRYGETGRPVIFCHGLFGQGRNWTQFGKTFGETHRCLLVDMPNHGRSGWTETFDYAAMADQVAGLIEAEEPAAVVGHSMGGKVAMLLALRHPALVERLCVVDIAPVDYHHTGGFRDYVEAMLAIDLDALETRSQAEAALSEAVPDPGVRAFLLQNLRRDRGEWSWQPNLALLGSSLEQLGGWPQEAVREPYPGPVLWVAGAESEYVRPEHDAAMSTLFPRERLVTVKSAGHWVHSQQPAIFTEILRRFLAA